MNQWGGDLNYRPEKTFSEKKKEKAKKEKRARKKREAVVVDANVNNEEAAQKNQSERDYRVGKTIAGATNHARQRKLEHLTARKHRQIRNAFIVFGTLAAIAVVVVVLINQVNKMISEREAKIVEKYPVEPTVTIVDENVGDNVSTRVKTFVARLEADAAEKNTQVDHVVLPFQKAREILIYYVGRNEYYRMTTERGSAVQAEDAERMMRYLDEKGLTPEYVDLRIEGKAYYK